MKRLTNKEFIEKSNKIHNYKYDYSKVKYISAKVKVCIICPVHGEFWQTPDKHFQKQGCKICGNIKNGNDHRSNTNIFINKARNIFPNYDYNLVEYTLSSNKVKIECKNHGIFEITPNNLLSGHGCPKCTGQFKNNVEFINKCKEIHNKYLYDKTNYINSTTKIIVTCPKHGDFNITPYHHLNKVGCPKCNNSKGELEILKYLDENNINYIYQNLIYYNNKKYFIDFYIPELNIAIEYNGIQHYKYIPYFHKGGIVDFEKQIYRDNTVLTYCTENNIKLKTIKYNEVILDELKKLIKTNEYD